MTQQEAMDILQAGYNVYLTGSAGSGKTYLLQRFITSLRLRKIKVGITASTGVASTHLSGMTINAWAGIGIKHSLSEKELVDLLKRKHLHRRFRDTQVLIIDEVSMLSAHTLEIIDKVLRAFKRRDEPFGGIQVVLSGDFFQLPPIEKDVNHESRSMNQAKEGNEISSSLSNKQPAYVYKSSVWEELDLKVCYLDKPYRQVEERFQSLLQEIRDNRVTKETWETLKERFLDPITPGMTPTRLYTHNIHAEKVNLEELSKIKNETYEYDMQVKGSEHLVAVMKRSCLAPEKLQLKKHALVMFVKNNSSKGYVNGTMGRITDFTPDGFPIVRTFMHQEIEVRPADWTIEEDGEIKARLTQIPLRLAWAITIHKSQGMTLDAAEIDLGKSFVTGMGYVALSRVRTLKGLRLRSINRTALSVNDDVIEFDKKLQELSAATAEELRESYWHKKNSSSSLNI